MHLCRPGFLPVHWAGLVPAVCNAVEQVAQAGVLNAVLSSAEVVIHHFVDYLVRDAASTVRNPKRKRTAHNQRLVTLEK